jgi:hypothetical protein
MTAVVKTLFQIGEQHGIQTVSAPLCCERALQKILGQMSLPKGFGRFRGTGKNERSRAGNSLTALSPDQQGLSLSVIARVYRSRVPSLLLGYETKRNRGHSTRE